MSSATACAPSQPGLPTPAPVRTLLCDSAEIKSGPATPVAAPSTAHSISTKNLQQLDPDRQLDRLLELRDRRPSSSLSAEESEECARLESMKSDLQAAKETRRVSCLEHE